MARAQCEVYDRAIRALDAGIVSKHAAESADGKASDNQGRLTALR